MKLADRETQLPTEYLDSLSDVEIAGVRKTFQRLATQQQQVTQRYQRAVAKIDSSIQRRAARARKTA